MAGSEEMIFEYRKIFSTIILLCFLMCIALIVILIYFQIDYWFNISLIIFLLVVGIILMYLFQFFSKTPYVITTESKLTIAYPLGTNKIDVGVIDEIHKESITKISIFYKDKHENEKTAVINLINLINEDQIKLGKYLDKIHKGSRH